MLLSLSPLNKFAAFIHKQSIHTLKVLLEDYAHIAAVYSGISHINPKSLLKKLQETKSHRLATAGKAAIQAFQQEQEMIAQHNWHVRYQKFFQTNAFWEKLKDSEAQPLQHIIDDFACYTSDALAKAIDKLHAIESWFKTAQAESEQQADLSKDSTMRKAYQQYLAESLELIKAEKIKIANSLYKRLSISAEKEDSRYDDPVHYVAQKLKSYGQSFNLPKTPRQGLTPALLQTFTRFIHRYGSEQQKTSLETKAWQFKLSGSDYVYVNRQVKNLVIPKSVMPHIPQTPGYFFQWSQRTRFNLPSQLQSYVNACANIPKPDIDTDLLLQGKGELLIQRDLALYHDLLKPLQQLEQSKKTGIASLFYPSLNTAVQLWQTYFKTQQESALQRQMAVLEKLSAQIIEKQQSNSLSEQLKITPKIKANLQKLIQAMSPYITASKNSRLEKRLAQVSKAIAQVQPLAEVCRAYLKSITQDVVPTGGKLNLLYRYHALYCQQEETFSGYEDARKSAIHSTLRRLQSSLTQYQDDIEKSDVSAANRLAENLFRDAVIVQKLGTSEEVTQLKNLLHQYIQRHIVHTFTLSLAANSAALHAQENLLLVLTGENFLADPTLHETMKQLQQCRQTQKTKEFETIADAALKRITERQGSPMSLPLQKIDGTRPQCT